MITCEVHALNLFQENFLFPLLLSSKIKSVHHLKNQVIHQNLANFMKKLAEELLEVLDDISTEKG